MAVMAKSSDISYCEIVGMIAATTAPLTPMQMDSDPNLNFNFNSNYFEGSYYPNSVLRGSISGNRNNQLYLLIKILEANNSNWNEEEENQLVRWPPIKSWRKKKLHPQHPVGGQIRNERMQANENQSRGSNSLYVKANMEGVPVGRLINFRVFNSYQTLTDMLVSMFIRCMIRNIYRCVAQQYNLINFSLYFYSKVSCQVSNV
ncbi:auxin-responsive protein IAA8-like isoform X2 [Lotus japonicus]|uniref:auxin-responsive protein IAA8-like isoform X2 n=1 Tax=Lotus japonicus TaxID=34305 RepID=UPI0025874728|nr:auxin-responsive protein IAA8-like isoform X2 [Lotus japonicus]